MALEYLLQQYLVTVALNAINLGFLILNPVRPCEAQPAPTVRESNIKRLFHKCINRMRLLLAMKNRPSQSRNCLNLMALLLHCTQNCYGHTVKSFCIQMLELIIKLFDVAVSSENSK
jgi:hypothetical protein